MKNFGTLFGYELKKLLKRKLAWVFVLLLSGLCVVSTVRASTSGGYVFYDITDEDGNPLVITGEESRASALEAVNRFSGRVMDDAFFREILDNVPDLSGLDGIERDIYFLTTDNAYSSPYHRLEEVLINPQNATEETFYAAQWEHTLTYLKNYGNGGLSGEEIAYWTRQAEQIQRPFVYQYPWPGTTKLLDFFYTLLSFLPVAAAVCLCTVFSEDRRTRADALVFSTRESRLPLYLAKVLAGAAMGALVGTVIVGTTVAAHLAVWGWKGLDACVQMYQHTCARPITIGQMLAPMLVLLVLYTLVGGGVAMLVSALTRSSIAALVAPVLLVLVLSGIHQLPYGWAGYLPENLMGWSGPNNVELVNVFGVYLDNFQFGSVLYLGLTILLLALCWLGWRHSAAGRA